MKSNLIKTSFKNSFFAFIYVVFVAYLISNGEKLFGKMTGILGAVSFLMLFVLSAAIVGTLIFAKPVMMYLDNNKKEAVKLVSYNIAWVLLFTIIIFVLNIII